MRSPEFLRIVPAKDTPYHFVSYDTQHRSRPDQGSRDMQEDALMRFHSSSGLIPHGTGPVPLHRISRWAAPDTRSWLERLLSTGVRKGSILLVDDQTDVCELLRFVLEREGYRVHAAGDGVRCLKMAKTLRPDLILLNYLMPAMDGLSALRQLKMNSTISYLKAVMYSGVSDFLRFRADALESGALDCLQSPFGVKTLLTVVERYLRS